MTGLGFIGRDKKTRYDLCQSMGQSPKLADSIAPEPLGKAVSALFSTIYILEVIITAMSERRKALIIYERSR